MSARKRPTTRRASYGIAAVLLLPPAALGVWHVISGLATGEDSFSRILQKIGYQELAPPSKFYGPGTIITVETRSDQSVRLHLACTIKPDTLAPFWQTSSTVDRTIATSVGLAFGAQGNALTAAAAKATGNRVKRVAVSLQDMRIVTMSHEDLLRIRGANLRGPCEEAVIYNLRAGARVCQTAEVLQADLAYRISYAEGLAVTEQTQLTRELEAKLDLGADRSGVDEVRGDDLYFGVKIGLNCFTLSNPQVAIRS